MEIPQRVQRAAVSEFRKPRDQQDLSLSRTVSLRRPRADQETKRNHSAIPEHRQQQKQTHGINHEGAGSGNIRAQ